MLKRSLIVALFFALPSLWAAVTPIVQPHVTFVDAAGDPCAGCKLYSYAAGTTTPQPTYANSSGIVQNPNPVILDAAGGAEIWFGSFTYKLTLTDALGTVIWTVDNVNPASMSPCNTPTAIQIASTSATTLDCDPIITINKIAHTLNVGVLPANHVTIGPLGTPTSWTFDTTSPDTARASIGAGTGVINSGTTGQLAYYAASGSTLSGTGALPSGTTATTQSASDNSTKVATTAYVATPGAIDPASLQIASGTAMTGNQGDGAKVQHSTGSPVSGNCAKFDANGNTIDSGGLCGGPTTPKTCNSNGCYRIDADGTIEAWGSSSTLGGATSASNLTITFPTTFTSTTHLFVVVTATSDATGDGNPHPADCHIVKSTLTTSGATAIIAAPTQIGGSGYANLAAGDYCSWHALGD